MRVVKTISVVLAIAIAGCGGSNDDELRTQDPAVMGGKADVPSWLRHIPTNWGCDSAVTGAFSGFDSAHLYSFEGKLGYELTFTFTAQYSQWRGAVVAVYDGETGDRLAISRSWPGNTARVVVTPEKNGKLLVAAYSVAWIANGSYELYAACSRIALTCTDNGQCGRDEYCAKSNCGQDDHVPGVCSPRPQACPQHMDPVCGCDGKTYGNGCKAASQGASLAHKGTCPQIAVDPAAPKAGETARVSLENSADQAIYLSNCGTFFVERKNGDTWEPAGPFINCFAFFLQALPEGDTIDSSMSIPDQAGTYRIRTSYGLECSAGAHPLDISNCRVVLPVISDEFTISRDACWGAWLDQNGNCRTPADGGYPDSCCDTARRTTCDTIAGDYAAAIRNNQSCNLALAAPQCQTRVRSSLACNNGCVSFINTTADLAGIDTHVADWTTYKCSRVPYICAQAACGPTIGSSCDPISSGSIQGTCRALHP